MYGFRLILGFAVVLLATLHATPTEGGELYGQIVLAPKSAPAKSATVVLSGSESVETADTGYYRVRGVATGWHVIVVTYAKIRSQELKVYVSDRTRANFELKQSKDKKSWILRRK